MGLFDGLFGSKEIDENSSAKDLAKFAKSKDEYIRQEVAEHKNCTIELLELLSKDEVSTVRKYVALNENCTTELLELLSKDEEFDVREGVAESPNCSKELLEVLKDDEWQQVCNAALEKLIELDPNLIQELIESGNEKYLNFLAGYSQITEENLLKIAKDCNHKILEKIFYNKNLKEKSIESLYKKHKNDENFHHLASEITRNTNTPVKIIKDIYESFKDPEDGIPFDRIMTNIAYLEKTPKDILAELSDHEEGGVRENVAMNLSTPLEINVKLVSDSLSYVISEALLTLYEKRTEPKDELLVILKDIVGKLSATGEKVGELGGGDVVSGGLMQEDVDFHKEKINSRIKELEG